MPTYIALTQWTSKGVENVKDSPARLQKAREAARAAGGEVKGFYMTMGRYDMVLFMEAPSDEAYARAMLAIASTGAVRTETLRAFSEEEYKRIVSSLP
jgi:uncharacterized protein with GYD domain